MSNRAMIVAILGILVLAVIAFLVHHHGGGFLSELGPALHGR